jgi:putative phosphoribosyl transferase
MIIFAHGSGSSATSSRNQIVAEILNDNGLGTLLFDLLTKEEQESDVRTQLIINELPGQGRRVSYFQTTIQITTVMPCVYFTT